MIVHFENGEEIKLEGKFEDMLKYLNNYHSAEYTSDGKKYILNLSKVLYIEKEEQDENTK